MRGLKPATKIVLIQLSERHNKDTGVCNPSIKTLAEDCEMDRTTVMRHLAILESLCLISTLQTGNEDGGRSNNQYRLHLPQIEPTDVSKVVKSDFATGVKSQSDRGLSRNPTGVKSHSCATLTLREPEEEPSLFGSEEPQRVAIPVVQDRGEEFWAAYPRCPRKLDKRDVLALFRKIVSGKHRTIPKTDPETIILAVKRFAQSGADPDFMPLPTTWLNKARWEDVPEPQSNYGGHRLRPTWDEVVR